MKNLQERWGRNGRDYNLKKKHLYTVKYKSESLSL